MKRLWISVGLFFVLMFVSVLVYSLVGFFATLDFLSYFKLWNPERTNFTDSYIRTFSSIWGIAVSIIISVFWGKDLTKKKER
jgi:hypothetical protein